MDAHGHVTQEASNMVTKIEPLLTIADLDLTPDDGNRYELIEGELFVSRAPGIPHQRIVHNLQMALGAYLLRNPLGMLVPGPGVIFSDLSGVIPDLVFVRQERQSEIAAGERVMGAPDLVIEVLSPGAENARRDRVVKRQLYRKYGVQEYWIVDPEQRAVEVYRRQRRSLERIGTFMDEDEITSPLFPGFRLKSRDIFSL
jgi:Uma2 family endonuclease